MKSTIITHVAHARHGEHAYFGHAVLSTLLGQETVSGLVALAILGRRVSDDERVLLDALATSLTAADPRIWPLKVSRLVASFGEMLSGYAAGQLAMLGTYVSPWIIGRAAGQLARLTVELRAKAATESSATIRDHATGSRRLDGYGIPLRERDERFEALRGFMQRSGRAALPHWAAQEALSEWMLRERRLAPNIAIGLAAALLDIGCSPTQAGALSTMLIEHTFAANAFEAAQQREPAMQKLPATDVVYVGPPPRVSPRASGAQ